MNKTSESRLFNFPLAFLKFLESDQPWSFLERERQNVELWVKPVVLVIKNPVVSWKGKDRMLSFG